MFMELKNQTTSQTASPYDIIVNRFIELSEKSINYYAKKEKGKKPLKRGIDWLEYNLSELEKDAVNQIKGLNLPYSEEVRLSKMVYDERGKLEDKYFGAIYEDNVFHNSP